MKFWGYVKFYFYNIILLSIRSAQVKNGLGINGTLRNYLLNLSDKFEVLAQFKAGRKLFQIRINDFY